MSAEHPVDRSSRFALEVWPLAAAGIFFFLFLGGVSLVVLRNTTEWAARQNLRRFEADARLAAAGPGASGALDPEPLRSLGVLAASLYDANGIRIAQAPALPNTILAPPRLNEEERAAAQDGRALERTSASPPHVLAGVPAGTGTFLLLVFDGAPLLEARRNLRILSAVVPIAVIVLAALAIPFVRRLLRPIEALEETARHAERFVGGASAAPEEAVGTFVRVIDELRSRTAELEELRRREKERADALAVTAETLVRSHPGGLLVLDEAGTLTGANAPAIEALGLPDSAVGRPASEMLRALPQLLDAVERAARGAPPVGEEVVVEDHASPPDGSGMRPLERTLAVTASRVIDPDGRALGTLLFLEERTRTRRLERELSKRRELAALGEMSAGIAHEFRNATATILGFARLAEKGQDDEARQRHLAGIRKEAEHVARVTGDFLLFARPERMRPEPVDVDALVEELVAEERLGDPAATFAVEGHFGTARADAALLRRALVNLLRNAREAAAASDPGRVVVRGESAGEGIVRIAVEDDGPGVPPELGAKVFVPFFSTKDSGTGLGLALVAKIAALHAGGVTVERSEALGGARFVLSLPPG